MIEVAFKSVRDTEARVKQEFLDRVGDSFKHDMEVIEVTPSVYEKDIYVPARVFIEVDADGVEIEDYLKWYLSGKFDRCAVSMDYEQ